MTPAKKRSTAAIDTTPLPDKLKKGKLTLARGKYLLTVGQRKIELPVGGLIEESEAKKLLGKDLAIVFSEKKPSDIVAIGTWPTPERKRWCYWITCYIPGPDIMRRLGYDVRMGLLNEMAAKKVISAEMYTEIKRGASAWKR